MTTQTTTPAAKATLTTKKEVKEFLKSENFPEQEYTITQKTFDGQKSFTVWLPPINGGYKKVSIIGLSANAQNSPPVYSAAGSDPASVEDIARLNAAQRVIDKADNLYLRAEGTV